MQGNMYISVAALIALFFDKIKNMESTIRLFCLLAFLSTNNILEVI